MTPWTVTREQWHSMSRPDVASMGDFADEDFIDTDFDSDMGLRGGVRMEHAE